MVCNIGNEADIKKTGQFLKDHKIVTEYLFNNAGRGLCADYSATTSDLIDKVFEANLKGMILAYLGDPQDNTRERRTDNS